MTRKRPTQPEEKPRIGWREWVSLPRLGVDAVKAKIDTGARTSSLHAFDVQIFRRDGVDQVRFKVHPFQDESQTTIACETELLEQRWVKSSSGHETLRPVIVTPVELHGRRWEIELTLINRDAMGFRMLLGRQSLKPFLIDPARSFVAGRGPETAKVKSKKMKKKKRTTKGKTGRRAKPQAAKAAVHLTPPLSAKPDRPDSESE